MQTFTTIEVARLEVDKTYTHTHIYIHKITHMFVNTYSDLGDNRSCSSRIRYTRTHTRTHICTY